MGNALSAVRKSLLHCQCRSTPKQKSDLESKDSDDAISSILSEPRRKRVRTHDYLYQVLFIEGKDSDVNVTALGESFALHKLYLNQSPYFSRMFIPSWKESTIESISLEINNPEISLASLRIVLGALYRDNIGVVPSTSVISILATASFLQVDKVIEKCSIVMLDSISAATALDYYYASCDYAVPTVKLETFRWLVVNLLSYFVDNPSETNRLNSDLLATIVKSRNLFVIETEYSLYLFLRYWVFVKETYDGNNTENLRSRDEPLNAATYFTLREDTTPFLQTPNGEKYADPFKGLKMKHITHNDDTINLISADNIIPKDWLEYLTEWFCMLRIDNGIDTGPSRLVAGNEIFERECVRTGKYLDGHTPVDLWQVPGFTFGLNLIVLFGPHGLKICNHLPQLKKLNKVHSVLYRARAVTLGEDRQINQFKTTGLRARTIRTNETITLLNDAEFPFEFPMIISLNLLVTSPENVNMPERKVSDESIIREDENEPDIMIIA